MKIINKNGYTKDELITWKIIVYKNIVESIQSIIRAIKKFDMQFTIEQNNVNFAIAYLLLLFN